MIDESIRYYLQSIYRVSEYNNLKNLKLFKRILYRNRKKH